MNCLQNLPRSLAVPLRDNWADSRKLPVVELVIFRAQPRKRIVIAMNATSGPTSNTEKSITESDKDKSEVYSHNMTEAMGAVLTYRHELGMNYNFILPDLIVGSCLQTPEDVDKLRSIGVKTIFCLQQDSDLAYFSVDIGAIQEYANSCDDIEHYRAEIRDFDAFDLRQRLPTVVSKLQKAINQNGGITYIHCTAGLGRAPAVALSYMFWVLGYPLEDAHQLLLRKRPCFPKLDAIKGATTDMLTGRSKGLIKLTWGGNGCSSVEVSGLDIGWGQRVPLKFDEDKGSWFLERELPEGKYEYKYIIDGEWTCNDDESVTKPNDDGHVNNYIHVHDVDSKLETKQLREHLMSDNVNLSEEQRRVIQEYLDTCIEE